MKKILVWVWVGSFIVLLSGCGLLDYFKSDEVNQEIQETPISSVDEAEKAKQVIRTFFEKAHQMPLMNLYEKSSTGDLPSELIEFIDHETLNSGIDNRNIPIHLPRIINYGDYYTISYELLRRADEQVRLDIEMFDYSNDNNSYRYFVQVFLKAKVVKQNTFENYFVMNEEAGFYQMDPQKGEIPEEQMDAIKLKSKYDVKINQNEDQYQIVEIVESSSAGVSHKRMDVKNNEFMDLLPYLEPEIVDENQVLEKDKQAIRLFLRKIFGLTPAQVDLLREIFTNGNDDAYFSGLEKFGVARHLDILLFIAGENLKDRYHIDHLPFQENIKSFDIGRGEFSNQAGELVNEDRIDADIRLSPRYTLKEKFYELTVGVQAYENGLEESTPRRYTFEYMIQLEEDSGFTYIKDYKRLNTIIDRSELMKLQ